MLGHVFVVEDAKDLAQIVRDVTRYGGAYRPEVCDFPALSPEQLQITTFSLGYLRIYSTAR